MAYTDSFIELSTALEQFNPCRVVSVYNYDNQLIGSYHVGDFIETLTKNDIDYTTINIDDSDETNLIIYIQELDELKLSDLIYGVKVTAQIHDKYFGDGKYWANVN